MNKSKRSYFVGRTAKIDENAPILYGRYAPLSAKRGIEHGNIRTTTPRETSMAGVVPGTGPVASGGQETGGEALDGLQMNISSVLPTVVDPQKKKRKERWSEEKKTAAKAERQIEAARREANGEIHEDLTAKKKKKEKKKEKKDIKIRKLSQEERVSGPGNASEAKTLRNTLGIQTLQEESLSEFPSAFEFKFDPKVHANPHDGLGGREGQLVVDAPTPSLSTKDKIAEESDCERQGGDGYQTVVHENKCESDCNQTVDGFVPRRIFVGGMPFGYSEDMIREYWEYCGPIETLDMMTFPDTGRFKGIAFITFATEEAFHSALSFDGTDCDGQILKVQKCKADNKRKFKQQATQEIRDHIQPVCITNDNDYQVANLPNTQVENRQRAQKVQGYNVAYVGNISFEARSEDIKSLFEPFGVTLIRLHTDKDTGKPKGYAHIHFKDEESLDRAMEMDGTPLFGRRIKVGFAQRKKTIPDHQ